MWKKVFLFVTLLGLTLTTGLPQDPRIRVPLKKVKTSADRIREHGYPAESHYVETKDNYVLNFFRIPYSPTLNNKDKPKPVVYIQHGMFSCSDCYLLNGPENALAYNFADAGYDVWLGNVRGTIYSRNNTRISLNHPHFWRFSWHEIGHIDVPTMIDYILDLTGEKSLHYVGHSQGTTMFFVMASTRPEYNEKIKTVQLLAPAIFMGNTTDAFAVALGPYVGDPDTIYSKFLGDQEFFPHNYFVQRVLDTACGGKTKFPEYCHTLYLMWSGSNTVNINATLLPQVAETHPSGLSTNQGIHFIQNHVSNEFRYFNHGPKQNMKLYGQEIPPDYPIEKITAPMYIYYGLADTSTDYRDIQRLPDYIVNLRGFYEIEDSSWAHLDFVFATEVKSLVNDPVIKICNEYEKTGQAP